MGLVKHSTLIRGLVRLWVSNMHGHSVHMCSNWTACNTTLKCDYNSISNILCHVTVIILQYHACTYHTCYLQWIDNCTIDNGGCEHLCVKGGMCLCLPGFQMSTDGKSCEGNIIGATSHVALCISGIRSYVHIMIS